MAENFVWYSTTQPNMFIIRMCLFEQRLNSVTKLTANLKRLSIITHTCESLLIKIIIKVATLLIVSHKNDYTKIVTSCYQQQLAEFHNNLRNSAVEHSMHPCTCGDAYVEPFYSRSSHDNKFNIDIRVCFVFTHQVGTHNK